MNGHVLIPSLSVLLLSTTAGCTDPLVGEWDVIEAWDREIPSTVTYSYAAAEVTFKTSSDGMVVEEDLYGEVEITFSTEIVAGDYSEKYQETLSMELRAVAAAARASYRIELSTNENTFDLDCFAADPDFLECEDDDGVDWSFERVED